MSEKSGFDFSGLRRVIGIGRQNKKLFYGVLFFTVLSAAISGIRPYITGNVIDDYILTKNMPGLLFQLMVIGGLLITESILQFYTGFLANVLAQDVIKKLRIRLFHHLINFKLQFFDRTPNGVLVTRSVSDIETIAEVFNDGVLSMLGDFLRIVFVVAIMYYTNWALATIVLLILPLMIIITRLFQKALKNVYQEERTLAAKLNSFVQERLTGMNIVQSFNRQNSEYNKFEEINQALKKNYLITVFYFSLLFPVVEVVTALAIGLLFIVGGYRAADYGDVSVGHIVAFFSYISMLTQPMRQIAERFNTIQRGLVGADRVFQILDSDERLPNNGTDILENVVGKIDFEQVEFSYVPENPVLKGISFSTNPGDMIAIVGATGAGKSTIVNLLSRFYDITSGTIKIDGKDIQSVELSNLRQQVAVVLQDVFLFNTTIIENITLGNQSKSLEEISEAAKKIGVHDFIMSLPKGYNTEVSERGNSISVGQRQLISFLRAYLYNPPILVLDEATSSIDSESEYLIQKATETLTKGRTSIVIAHRLATIQNADKILVMDQGQIVESGTHEELLTKNGYYNTLYETQFKQVG